MKTGKMIKLFSAPLVIGSAIVVGSASVVSCGHKDNNTWDDFKKDAQAETAIKIVNTTKPKGWETTPDLSFKISNFKADSSSSKVTLDITEDTLGQVASFEIDYQSKTAYSVSDWKCVVQPHSDVKPTWADFKSSALSAEAPTIAYQAKPWDNASLSAQWTVGTAAQRTWTEDEAGNAIFDNWGGTGNTDFNMKGTPFVLNESKHQIAAIVSKKLDDNGSFDTAPIEAIATFSNVAYTAASWTSFNSPTNSTVKGQLQSKNKITELYKSDIAATNFSTFQGKNWANESGGVDHQGSLRKRTILNLITSKYADATDASKVTYVTDSAKQSDPVSPDINAKGLGFTIKYLFTSQSKTITMTLTKNCLFINGLDGTNGMNAFDYTWNADFS